MFCFVLFIYLWLCWVFVSVRGLSPVAASRGHSSSRCAGLLLSRPLLLRSAGSVTVAHGPSCSVACGIFPDQGSNPCPLHWQADSQPLRHQGSPKSLVFNMLSLRYLLDTSVEMSCYTSRYMGLELSLGWDAVKLYLREICNLKCKRLNLNKLSIFCLKKKKKQAKNNRIGPAKESRRKEIKNKNKE